MTLGFYENFPLRIHWIEKFTSNLPARQLQQKLIQIFYEINKKELSFEEVTNPTIPDCKVIFEFGLADSECFSYIDNEEEKEAIDLIGKELLHTIDFFCGIRYYKGKTEKKVPLKFDYYLLRTIYDKGTFEVNIHHERGPRYISPQDLTQLIFKEINENSTKKVLKKIKT
ncbi:MAG: hypothetical protein ABSA79_07115 [Candidatus Bathyarchaeia archaeon]